VCQTVARIDGAHVTFDAMQETLRKTAIGAERIVPLPSE
jgi:riboflavin synthase alpha subunit